ncbi:gephyrin-like molybdotransferase Glp [Roseibium sp.]|uniref:molybdopterin molybdotransferase MoeA n=1 Tax=Roseibium sp. TaxID=1936156 RepID=UPI003A977DBE
MTERPTTDSPLPAATGNAPLASVDETIAAALGLCTPVNGTDTVQIKDAVGRVTAYDVVSLFSLPLRDHSAVDGYAMAGHGRGPFRIVGNVIAGDAVPERLAQGEALRIMTGAPIPAGTESVVMQEHVEVADGAVSPTFDVPPGDNIRRKGEDVSSMDVLVKAGTRLDPRHVAVLAASGYQGIEVRRRLKVALLSTGNELRDPGVGMGQGSIFDTNRPMLSALLSEENLEITDLGIRPDNRDIIADTLAKAAETHDMIITSGGVSVGVEDHLRPAVVQAGGKIQNWRMAIKPGKPITIGNLGQAIYLGLPGNPLACFVDFLLVGRPVLSALCGRPYLASAPSNATAGFHLTRRPGRREFFPASVVGLSESGLPVIEKIGRAGSARLMPLIEADGLGVIDSDCETVEPGAALQFFPFRSELVI